MFRSGSVLLLVALVCVVPYWCEAQSEADQQATIKEALKIASQHKDRNGNNRPVGKPFLFINPNGGGSADEYHIGTQVGVGATVFRSNDGRHTIGVGATRGQGFGRENGQNFQIPPTYGGGVGYTFKFNKK